MQATRRDLYMHSRFANFNSFMVVLFATTMAISVLVTLVGAFSQMPI